MEGCATDVTMLRKRLDITDKKLLKARLIARLPGAIVHSIALYERTPT
jgi:hypothetical protein